MSIRQVGFLVMIGEELFMSQFGVHATRMMKQRLNSTAKYFIKSLLTVLIHGALAPTRMQGVKPTSKFKNKTTRTECLLMSKIVFIKESRNADFHDLGNYTIRIPHKVEYSFRRTNNEIYSPEEGDMLSHKTVKITNKVSGAPSTKRCYQYEDTLLQELENDYNGSQTQFNWR